MPRAQWTTHEHRGGAIFFGRMLHALFQVHSRNFRCNIRCLKKRDVGEGAQVRQDAFVFGDSGGALGEGSAHRFCDYVACGSSLSSQTIRISSRSSGFLSAFGDVQGNGASSFAHHSFSLGGSGLGNGNLSACTDRSSCVRLVAGEAGAGSPSERVSRTSDPLVRTIFQGHASAYSCFFSSGE